MRSVNYLLSLLLIPALAVGLPLTQYIQLGGFGDVVTMNTTGQDGYVPVYDNNGTTLIKSSLIVCDNGTATILTRNATLAQNLGCTI